MLFLPRFPSRLVIVAFVFVFPLLTNAHFCSDGFNSVIFKYNVTRKCRRKNLGAELAWNFDGRTRQLEIAFGSPLRSESGWLAWGLNPVEPRMVGTRALIGIKLENNSTEIHGYNVTGYTKRGCQLLPPADDLVLQSLGVRSFNFTYVKEIEYYVILATFVLPHEYDAARAHVVWQVGDAAVAAEPLPHLTSLKHLSTTETVDLNSGNVVTSSPNLHRSLVTVHGTLNIIGWGTFLPVGVIISRYFREFPKKFKPWEKLHIGCQICGYIIGSTGWAIGLWLGQTSKYYSFPAHRNLGIIIFTFTTIQMMALCMKPKSNEAFRPYWNMYHHSLGYSLLVLIWLNIFMGIKIVELVHAWKRASIAVLGGLGVVVLLLESYTWIKFLLNRLRD